MGRAVAGCPLTPLDTPLLQHSAHVAPLMWLPSCMYCAMQGLMREAVLEDLILVKGQQHLGSDMDGASLL